jgi:hypothetical protein
VGTGADVTAFGTTALADPLLPRRSIQLKSKSGSGFGLI